MLKQSPRVTQVFCAPGNAGTALEDTNVDIKPTDAARLVKFAVTEKIGLAVIGPEAALVVGVTDALEAAGIPTFGPSQAAAELEGSKIFMKELLRHHAIPSAEFTVFDNFEAAENYINDREESRLVVKADGLCSGRVLGVTALGDSISNAKFKAYQAVKCIRWDGSWCRKDISNKAREDAPKQLQTGQHPVAEGEGKPEGAETTLRRKPE